MAFTHLRVIYSFPVLKIWLLRQREFLWHVPRQDVAGWAFGLADDGVEFGAVGAYPAAAAAVISRRTSLFLSLGADDPDLLLEVGDRVSRVEGLAVFCVSEPEVRRLGFGRDDVPG